MTRHGCFLILLLLWGQIDDAWPIAAAAPSALLSDSDDDNYLPQQRRAEEHDASVQPKPAFVGRKSDTAPFPLVHRGVNPATPFASAPLHLLMFLQI
jgi:hypothetical protein